MQTHRDSKASASSLQMIRFRRRTPAGRNPWIIRAAALAVGCLAAAHALNAGTTQTWNPGNAGGGNGTWDAGTTDAWDANGSDPWVNGDDALFQGTAGTVTVAAAGVSVETSTFATTGYMITGGPLTLTGTNPGFTTSVTATTINSTIEGTLGASFVSTSNGNSFTLGSGNSYTGTTTIQAVTLYVPTLALTGTNSSVGSSGTIAFGGVSASQPVLVYTGSGATTDRLWNITYKNTVNIKNNGTGALNFTATGNAVTDTAGNCSLQLQGSYSAGSNSFGETLADPTSYTTSVGIQSNQWALTGTNTYSGGTTLGTASSAATVFVSNASSLGAGTVTLANNGTISDASSALTMANAINTGTFTLKASNVIATTTAVFNVGGLITGTGSVTLTTGSGSADGPVELSNDSNSFSGAFGTGLGGFQFTSIANAGSPSSLGEPSAGNATITISNSTSYTYFDYVGSGNDTTTRQINWAGTTGSLTLQSNGGGTVQYLATGNLRTGSGANSLNLEGTSTGSNVLSEVIADTAGGVTSVNKRTTSTASPDTGNWILTAANTYTGATTINGGTLTVDATNYSNPNASISGSGTITIGTAGTLHLINTSASGATSMLSSSAAVSVVSSGSNYSTITLDLNGHTQTVSTLNVNGTFQDPGIYGSLTYYMDNGGTSSLTAEQTADENYFGSSNGALMVTATPEPSTLAVASMGACGLLARRRRRRS